MILSQAKYSYTPYEMRKCIRSEDFWKYKKDLKKDTVDEVSENASIYFNSINNQLANIICTSLRDSRVFTSNSIEETLCSRRTDQILRRSLNIYPANRNNEVKQLITILRTEPYGYILRTDISSFFESVELKKVIEKLETEGLRNPSCLKYLKALNQTLINEFNYTGLPRGLPCSSTLAEFILRKLDQSLTTMPTVIFYSRFVDDISIVFLDKKLKMKERVLELLPFNLELNTSKTKFSSLKSNSNINYLGYNIGIGNNKYVKISNSKIGKAKKRIVLSLNSYMRDRNFNLLSDRMKFLTSNIIIKKASRENSVCTGYRYDYMYCTDDEIINQLCELDQFFMSIIYSKRYHLGVSLRKTLRKEQVEELKKFSFKSGYRLKITHNMTRDRISRVKRAWKYE